MGDLAFLPTGGNGVIALNIASPTNVVQVAQFEVPYYALELSVAANGRHVYAGTVERTPELDRTGGVHCWQILTQDPDDAPPGRWKNFSPRQTSWDLEYEADALPTAAHDERALTGSLWPLTSQWLDETGPALALTIADARTMVEACRKAGVKMAFGTDAGVFPHGWNARQFAHMVQWGQSPMQAIQSATTAAAAVTAEPKAKGVPAGRRRC